MILPDFILHSRVNQHWQYSGIDSIERCVNKDHFRSYPHPVDYVYNSRGFRDSEWPESTAELKRAIWCVGDSFTVGIGQSFAHTWPQVLSAATGRRCINISMDGASNDWIARKVQRIIDTIDPDNVILMWSYVHRREYPNSALTDEQRRMLTTRSSDKEDYVTWVSLSNKLVHLSNSVIQTTIPHFCNSTDQGIMHSIEQHWNNIKDYSWPVCPCTLEEFNNLPQFILDELAQVHNCYESFKLFLDPQYKLPSIDVDDCVQLYCKDIIHCRYLDYARDYHHFDLLTVQWLVNRVCQQLDR